MPPHKLGFFTLAAALLVSACNVFDASLYEAAAMNGDAGLDAADGPTNPVDAASDEASNTNDGPADGSSDTAIATDAAGDKSPGMEVGPPLVLADRCEGTVPVLTSSAIALSIDTTPLAGDYSELVACVGHDLPGNDGFLAVDMKAGEKWHVHITPLATDYDPGVYILASCDERSCSSITAIDECGAGKSEHLSFVAPQTGRYLVGVDSAKSGGGPATILILRPTCGNGMIEHSETCDDGNTTSGDGCDSLCRKELTAAVVIEAEPNDDPRAANVLGGTSQAGGMRVSAQLATRCDHDMWSVTVPQGASITARVADTGTPCTAEGATVSLTMLEADGQIQRGVGSPPGADGCPAIDSRHAFATNLPAGEYFLLVKRSAGEAAWPYQLTVETKTP